MDTPNTAQGYDWKPDGLRLTLFCAEPVPLQLARGWLFAITGEQPQQIIEKPASYELTESTALPDGRYIQVQTNAHRVDVLLSAVTPISDGFPIPTLGPLADELQAFITTLEKWLCELDLPIIRIALGERAYCQVSDQEYGYALLQKFLPFVKMDGKRMRDFTLQFNIRAEESKAATYINRVSKWSVVGFHPLFLTASTDTVFAYACAVDIDVNSPAENKKTIEREQRAALLNEFLTHTNTIVSGGDWCQT